MIEILSGLIFLFPFFHFLFTHLLSRLPRYDHYEFMFPTPGTTGLARSYLVLLALSAFAMMGSCTFIFSYTHCPVALCASSNIVFIPFPSQLWLIRGISTWRCIMTVTNDAQDDWGQWHYIHDDNERTYCSLAAQFACFNAWCLPGKKLRVLCK
jgi:hypothetical protein